MAATVTVELSDLPNAISPQIVGGPPSAGQTCRTLPMVGSGMTASHELYSWRVTDKAVSIWPLTLEVNKEQYTTLSQLFHQHLFGPGKSFTYKHTNGDVYSDVRWIDDEFGFERLDDETFRVNFTLRIPNVHIGDSSQNVM